MKNHSTTDQICNIVGHYNGSISNLNGNVISFSFSNADDRNYCRQHLLNEIQGAFIVPQKHGLTLCVGVA